MAKKTKQVRPEDICDSNAEGNMLPALADYFADFLLSKFDASENLRLGRIQRRMSDADYFGTPESASDLDWLKAMLAKIGGPNMWAEYWSKKEHASK